MNDYVATRSDVKLTFPLVSINENYCSWNRSSITTVPYSLLLSTSLIKLRKLSENFTVPPCAHVPPIFLPENPRLLVSDSFFDRFQTKTEIPTTIVCTRHDNSFHGFTINLERHPPPPPVKVSRVRLLLRGSNTGARLHDTFTAGLRASCTYT